MEKLIKSHLTSDDEHCYEGYYIEDYTWNGFKVPYFTKEVANQIISDVNKDNQDYFKFWYDEKKDQYIGIDKQLKDEDNSHQNPDEYTITFDTQVFTIDNKEVTLYGIGASYWTWSICNPDEFKQIKF